MQSKNHDRYFIPGLSRGLAVLRMFSRETPVRSVTEIANELGISRSSAFRITYTLSHLGLLENASDSKKYILSPKVLDLGFAYLSSLSLVDATRSMLTNLRDTMNVSAHLVIRDGAEAVYVAHYGASGPIASNVNVGTRFPAYATAPGQVLLGELSDEQITTLLGDVQMPAYSKKTPDSMQSLLERVEEGRNQGYLLSWGYFEKSVASVAAPIRDSNESIKAVINVTCPITQFSRADFKKNVVPKAKEVAGVISQSLGYRG